MALNQFLILSAFLFCTGVYGVLARRNAVLVLMSIELMLNAVNINLVAFSAFTGTSSGAGLRPVRHHDRRGRGRGSGSRSCCSSTATSAPPDLDEVDQLKG